MVEEVLADLDVRVPAYSQCMARAGCREVGSPVDQYSALNSDLEQLRAGHTTVRRLEHRERGLTEADAMCKHETGINQTMKSRIDAIYVRWSSRSERDVQRFMTIVSDWP